MTPFASTVLRHAAVAVAMLRGIVEFGSLQRWRLREWMSR